MFSHLSPTRPLASASAPTSHADHAAAAADDDHNVFAALGISARNGGGGGGGDAQQRANEANNGGGGTLSSALNNNHRQHRHSISLLKGNGIMSLQQQPQQTVADEANGGGGAAGGGGTQIASLFTPAMDVGVVGGGGGGILRPSSVVPWSVGGIGGGGAGSEFAGDFPSQPVTVDRSNNTNGGGGGLFGKAALGGLSSSGFGPRVPSVLNNVAPSPLINAMNTNSNRRRASNAASRGLRNANNGGGGGGGGGAEEGNNNNNFPSSLHGVPINAEDRIDLTSTTIFDFIAALSNAPRVSCCPSMSFKELVSTAFLCLASATHSYLEARASYNRHPTPQALTGLTFASAILNFIAEEILGSEEVMDRVDPSAPIGVGGGNTNNSNVLTSPVMNAIKNSDANGNRLVEANSDGGMDNNNIADAATNPPAAGGGGGNGVGPRMSLTPATPAPPAGLPLLMGGAPQLQPLGILGGGGGCGIGLSSAAAGPNSGVLGRNPLLSPASQSHQNTNFTPSSVNNNIVAPTSLFGVGAQQQQKTLGGNFLFGNATHTPSANNNVIVSTSGSPVTHTVNVPGTVSGSPTGRGLPAAAMPISTGAYGGGGGAFENAAANSIADHNSNNNHNAHAVTTDDVEMTPLPAASISRYPNIGTSTSLTNTNTNTTNSSGVAGGANNNNNAGANNNNNTTSNGNFLISNANSTSQHNLNNNRHNSSNTIHSSFSPAHNLQGIAAHNNNSSQASPDFSRAGAPGGGGNSNTNNNNTCSGATNKTLTADGARTNTTQHSGGSNTDVVGGGSGGGGGGAAAANPILSLLAIEWVAMWRAEEANQLAEDATTPIFQVSLRISRTFRLMGSLARFDKDASYIKKVLLPSSTKIALPAAAGGVGGGSGGNTNNAPSVSAMHPSQQQQSQKFTNNNFSSNPAVVVGIMNPLVGNIGMLNRGGGGVAAGMGMGGGPAGQLGLGIGGGVVAAGGIGLTGGGGIVHFNQQQHHVVGKGGIGGGGANQQQQQLTGGGGANQQQQQLTGGGAGAAALGKQTVHCIVDVKNRRWRARQQQLRRRILLNQQFYQQSLENTAAAGGNFSLFPRGFMAGGGSPSVDRAYSPNKNSTAEIRRRWSQSLVIEGGGSKDPTNHNKNGGASGSRARTDGGGAATATSSYSPSIPFSVRIGKLLLAIATSPAALAVVIVLFLIGVVGTLVLAILIQNASQKAFDDLVDAVKRERDSSGGGGGSTTITLAPIEPFLTADQSIPPAVVCAPAALAIALLLFILIPLLVTVAKVLRPMLDFMTSLLSSSSALNEDVGGGDEREASGRRRTLRLPPPPGDSGGGGAYYNQGGGEDELNTTTPMAAVDDLLARHIAGPSPDAMALLAAIGDERTARAAITTTTARQKMGKKGGGFQEGGGDEDDDDDSEDEDDNLYQHRQQQSNSQSPTRQGRGGGTAAPRMSDSREFGGAATGQQQQFPRSQGFKGQGSSSSIIVPPSVPLGNNNNMLLSPNSLLAAAAGGGADGGGDAGATSAFPPPNTELFANFVDFRHLKRATDLLGMATSFVTGGCVGPQSNNANNNSGGGKNGKMVLAANNNGNPIFNPINALIERLPMQQQRNNFFAGAGADGNLLITSPPYANSNIVGGFGDGRGGRNDGFFAGGGFGNNNNGNNPTTQTEIPLSQTAINDHLIIIGVDANFRVSLWNAAAERVTGYRSDEVMGHLINNLVDERALDAMNRIVNHSNTNATRLVSLPSVRILGKNENVVELRTTLSSSVIRNARTVVALCGTAQDNFHRTNHAYVVRELNVQLQHEMVMLIHAIRAEYPSLQVANNYFPMQLRNSILASNGGGGVGGSGGSLNNTSSNPLMVIGGSTTAGGLALPVIPHVFSQSNMTTSSFQQQGGGGAGGKRGGHQTQQQQQQITSVPPAGAVSSSLGNVRGVSGGGGGGGAAAGDGSSSNLISLHNSSGGMLVSPPATTTTPSHQKATANTTTVNDILGPFAAALAAKDNQANNNGFVPRRKKGGGAERGIPEGSTTLPNTNSQKPLDTPFVDDGDDDDDDDNDSLIPNNGGMGGEGEATILPATQLLVAPKKQNQNAAISDNDNDNDTDLIILTRPTEASNTSAAAQHNNEEKSSSRSTDERSGGVGGLHCGGGDKSFLGGFDGAAPPPHGSHAHSLGHTGNNMGDLVAGLLLSVVSNGPTPMPTGEDLPLPVVTTTGGGRAFNTDGSGVGGGTTDNKGGGGLLIDGDGSTDDAVGGDKSSPMPNLPLAAAGFNDPLQLQQHDGGNNNGNNNNVTTGTTTTTTTTGTSSNSASKHNMKNSSQQQIFPFSTSLGGFSHNEANSMATAGGVGGGPATFTSTGGGSSSAVGAAPSGLGGGASPLTQMVLQQQQLLSSLQNNCHKYFSNDEFAEFIEQKIRQCLQLAQLGTWANISRISNKMTEWEQSTADTILGNIVRKYPSRLDLVFRNKSVMPEVFSVGASGIEAALGAIFQATIGRLRCEITYNPISFDSDGFLEFSLTSISGEDLAAAFGHCLKHSNSSASALGGSMGTMIPTVPNVTMAGTIPMPIILPTTSSPQSQQAASTSANNPQSSNSNSPSQPAAIGGHHHNQPSLQNAAAAINHNGTANNNANVNNNPFATGPNNNANSNAAITTAINPFNALGAASFGSPMYQAMIPGLVPTASVITATAAIPSSQHIPVGGGGGPAGLSGYFNNATASSGGGGGGGDSDTNASPPHVSNVFGGALNNRSVAHSSLGVERSVPTNITILPTTAFNPPPTATNQQRSLATTLQRHIVELGGVVGTFDTQQMLTGQAYAHTVREGKAGRSIFVRVPVRLTRTINRAQSLGSSLSFIGGGGGGGGGGGSVISHAASVNAFAAAAEYCSFAVYEPNPIYRHAICDLVWSNGQAVMIVETFEALQKTLRSTTIRVDCIVISVDDEIGLEMARFLLEPKNIRDPNVSVAASPLVVSAAVPGSGGATSLAGAVGSSNNGSNGSMPAAAYFIPADRYTIALTAEQLLTADRVAKVFDQRVMKSNRIHTIAKPYRRSHVTALIRDTTMRRNELAQRVQQEERKKRLFQIHRNAPWVRGALLGKGAYGDVYEAFNTLTKGRMAVKEIQTRVMDKVKEEEFANEISVMCELTHPNIVQYFYCEKSERGILLFMELCDGGHLGNYIAKHEGKKLSLLETVVITRQLVSALAYLHGMNFAHRDIKPENVLLTSNTNEVKLTDFGTAARVLHSAGEKPFTETAGTMRYMSPEVFNGEPYGTACDVWSVAILVLDMLGVKVPWLDGKDFFAVNEFYTTTIYENTSQPIKLPDEITGEARSFVEACLVVDQGARASMSTLAHHPFLANKVEGGVYGYVSGYDAKAAAATFDAPLRSETPASESDEEEGEDGQENEEEGAYNVDGNNGNGEHQLHAIAVGNNNSLAVAGGSSQNHQHQHLRSGDGTTAGTPSAGHQSAGDLSSGGRRSLHSSSMHRSRKGRAGITVNVITNPPGGQSGGDDDDDDDLLPMFGNSGAAGGGGDAEGVFSNFASTIPPAGTAGGAVKLPNVAPNANPPTNVVNASFGGIGSGSGGQNAGPFIRKNMNAFTFVGMSPPAAANGGVSSSDRNNPTRPGGPAATTPSPSLALPANLAATMMAGGLGVGGGGIVGVLPSSLNTSNMNVNNSSSLQHHQQQGGGLLQTLTVGGSSGNNTSSRATQQNNGNNTSAATVIVDFTAGGGGGTGGGDAQLPTSHPPTSTSTAVKPTAVALTPQQQQQAMNNMARPPSFFIPNTSAVGAAVGGEQQPQHAHQHHNHHHRQKEASLPMGMLASASESGHTQLLANLPRPPSSLIAHVTSASNTDGIINGNQHPSALAPIVTTTAVTKESRRKSLTRPAAAATSNGPPLPPSSTSGGVTKPPKRGGRRDDGGGGGGGGNTVSSSAMGGNNTNIPIMASEDNDGSESGSDIVPFRPPLSAVAVAAPPPPTNTTTAHPAVKGGGGGTASGQQPPRAMMMPPPFTGGGGGGGDYSDSDDSLIPQMK